MTEQVFPNVRDAVPQPVVYGEEPVHMPVDMAGEMRNAGEQERDPEAGKSESSDTEPLAVIDTEMRPAA